MSQQQIVIVLDNNDGDEDIQIIDDNGQVIVNEASSEPGATRKFSERSSPSLLQVLNQQEARRPPKIGNMSEGFENALATMAAKPIFPRPQPQHAASVPVYAPMTKTPIFPWPQPQHAASVPVSGAPLPFLSLPLAVQHQIKGQIHNFLSNPREQRLVMQEWRLPHEKLFIHHLCERIAHVRCLDIVDKGTMAVYASLEKVNGYSRPADERIKRAKTQPNMTLQPHPQEIEVPQRSPAELLQPDALKSAKIYQPKVIAQPKKISTKLKSFQCEGLDWMLHQEESLYKGGILADEMGMGKTIQVISLLVSAPEKTLVICPVVAIHQWKEQIRTHTKGGILEPVMVYHGPNRSSHANAFSKANVVITSFSVVEVDYRRQNKESDRSSPLHALTWGRIVLDEAHVIKERNSNTAKAVFALTSRFHWCLTGTPLQNRVGELYSLVRFLGTAPYAHYFCDVCDCQSLNWNFSLDEQTCPECNHSRRTHYCFWNRAIAAPLQQGFSDQGREAHRLLRSLLKNIMLRRSKVDRNDEMGLPPRRIIIRKAYFDEMETDYYQALQHDAQVKFQKFVEAGTVVKNYVHIFSLLTQLRQAADHPWLVAKKAEGGALVCGICKSTAEDAIQTSCKHTFCREELSQYLASNIGDTPLCPTCFQSFSVNLSQPEIIPSDSKGKATQKKLSILSRIDRDKFESSTKIDVLLEELFKIRQKAPGLKSIVFSQFTQFLDLLEWRLGTLGYVTEKLDGRMTLTQRSLAIDSFNSNPAVTVFLISLKTGGVALNLTAANHAFLMDPWWNPAAENQASDRIHRLGQIRPVAITRIIIEDSVDSRILLLQEKKKFLFQSTIEGDNTALTKLTLDDMKFLFKP